MTNYTCPNCGGKLVKDVFSGKLMCRACKAEYKENGGILDMVTPASVTPKQSIPDESSSGGMAHPGKVLKVMALVLLILAILGAIGLTVITEGKLVGIAAGIALGGVVLYFIMYTIGDISEDIKSMKNDRF